MKSNMEFNDVLDNSMISDFRLCPRYFQLRHLELLSPKSDSNKFKAAFGTALHAGLEVWYTERKENAKEATSLSDQAFIDSWTPYEGQDERGIRTIIKGLLIMEEYRKRYETEDFEMEYTEIGGAFSLEEFLILFKCDGLAIKNGKRMVFETKTSANKGYLIVKPNSQLDTYMSGISTLIEEEVNGAIFNQIYFRKGKAKEPQVDTISFVREETIRTKEELKEWRQDTLMWARSIRTCSDKDYYPKNTNSCTAYGGCQFIHICKLPPSDTRESVKESLYTKELWEPWEGARGIDAPQFFETKKKGLGEQNGNEEL